METLTIFFNCMALVFIIVIASGAFAVISAIFTPNSGLHNFFLIGCTIGTAYILAALTAAQINEVFL